MRVAKLSMTEQPPPHLWRGGWPWRCAVLCSALALSACGGCDQVESTSTQARSSDSNRSAASGYAALLGVVTYEVAMAPDTDANVTVRLLGGSDAPLGLLAVATDSSGVLQARLTTHDGAEANLTASGTLDATSGAAMFRVDVHDGNHSLGIELYNGADAVMQVMALRARNLGDEAPGIGLLADDGNTSVLIVADENGTASAEDIAIWFEQVELTSLLHSPAATLLWATFADGGWVEVLAAEVDRLPAVAEDSNDSAIDEAPASLLLPRRAALKVPTECAGIAGKIAWTALLDSAPSCCTDCLAQGPSAARLPPLGQMLAAARCGCCAYARGASLRDLMACVLALKVPEVYTDDRCSLLHGAAGGNSWKATSDSRGCYRDCDATACQAFCAAKSPAKDGLCEPDCRCSATPDQLCTERFGDQYCGGASRYKVDYYKCPRSVCGDGSAQMACALHPASAEVCDPSAPATGCAAGVGCADNCKACDTTCGCLPEEDPSGCAEGQACSPNCQCTGASPACANAVDFVLADGAWCDPEATSNPCPQGSICRSDVCRCSACGDGFLSPGEECEANVVGADCPGNQICDACKCITNCGNGAVDPGEQCDGAGGAQCAAGYTCNACTCQQETVTCWDGGDGCNTNAAYCWEGGACDPDAVCVSCGSTSTGVLRYCNPLPVGDDARCTASDTCLLATASPPVCPVCKQCACSSAFCGPEGTRWVCNPMPTQDDPRGWCTEPNKCASSATGSCCLVNRGSYYFDYFCDSSVDSGNECVEHKVEYSDTYCYCYYCCSGGACTLKGDLYDCTCPDAPP